LHGCSLEQAQTFPEPPVSSYTAGTFHLKVGDTTTTVAGATVSLDFFSAQKVQPLLGRLFVPDDSGVGASRVVIFSRSLWQRSFGASPTIIGQPIDLDGSSAIVVGITPPGFEFPNGAELWVLKGGG